jgi:alpha,alpha-trehalase
MAEVGDAEREGSVPISDYALLSNCRGSALVSRDGSIDWCCLPRFDSPAIFSRLLGQHAGFWQIAPTVSYEVERRYIPDTMVLETEFQLSGATVRLTDALVLSPEVGSEEIGPDSPPTIVRIVECLEGEAPMRCVLAPRPEYGMTQPYLVPTEGGLVSMGGPVLLSITWPFEADLPSATKSERFLLSAGQRMAFALTEGLPWGEPPAMLSEEDITFAMAGTRKLWEQWSANHPTRYTGPYGAHVKRSALVLQALQYAKTKAIVAAPTTSLPEAAGGSRNWDYRFAWVRDASMATSALAEAAHHFKAKDFFMFFVTAAAGNIIHGGDLQILYGIDGRRHLPESTLDHLEGYGGAAPVRIGNGAWNQIQLDIFGHLLQAAWTLHQSESTFEPAVRRFLRDLADCAARRWREKDSGIWEQRAGLQHTLFSKLMCWVALDRAIRIAPAIAATDHAVEHWKRERDSVRAAILDEGWSKKLGAFKQSVDVEVLDAATLMIPIMGLLPADDERVVSTVEAIQSNLTDERGFVFRYHGEDGLQGDEGTFVICSFWLVTCLALMGRDEAANDLFKRLLDHSNDVGLLSEEMGPNGEMLGNFPQAFTHIGLLTAAFALEGRLDLILPQD